MNNDRAMEHSTDKIVEAICQHVQDDSFVSLATELTEELEKVDAIGDAIEPLLQLMESNPDVDMGTPGPLVHFMERFPDTLYVPKLLASLHRCPVPHTIWMLNRLINSCLGEARELLLGTLKSLTERSDLNDDVRNEAFSFLKLHEDPTSR